MTRERGYYRHKDSTVWHFHTSCRYWFGVIDSLVNRWQVSRPHSGTLCDYCQSLERKKK